MGYRSLELEPNEPTAPLQTLDEAIRVVILSDAVTSPDDCGAGQGIWHGPAAPELVNGIMTRRTEFVTVDFYTPLQVMAEKYFRRLFPRLQVVHARPVTLPFDLLLSINVTSSFTGGKGADHEVTVTVLGSAEGMIGNQIAWVRGVGHASHPSNLPWTVGTDGLALARSALAQAQSQVFTNFFYDQKIRSYLRARAAYRAQPPRLETTAKFVDREALLPNGRLDAGERARLEVEVTNYGPGPAQDVKVLLGPGHRGVSFPDQAPIGDLEARSYKYISIPISGDASLADGVIELNLKTIEKRGYEGRPLALRIETEGPAHPNLQIASVQLKEDGGSNLRARDDQLVNGEKIDCVVRVRNAGAAQVKAPVLRIVAPNDIVRVDKAQDNLPAIPAHAETEGHLVVFIPATLAGSSLPTSASSPLPASDPGALCCQVTKVELSALDDATLERCGYARSGQRRTVRYSTSMQVQQVRVVGHALWVEVTAGAHPGPLAAAIAAATLRLVDARTHRALPGLTLRENFVGNHMGCRVMLTTSPPPRVGQRLTLTVPPEALSDIFFHHPAGTYSLTFSWPPADRVLEELAAPVLHKVSIRNYKLVIELSLEPDLASARSAIVVDGKPFAWRLGEDHYTLISVDDVPTGHHALTIGTGLTSLGGHHLAAAASYSLDMDDEEGDALICDAGWEP